MENSKNELSKDVTSSIARVNKFVSFILILSYILNKAFINLFLIEWWIIPFHYLMGTWVEIRVLNNLNKI